LLHAFFTSRIAFGPFVYPGLLPVLVDSHARRFCCRDTIAASPTAAQMIQVVRDSKSVFTIMIGCDKDHYSLDLNGEIMPRNIVWNPNLDHNKDGSEPWHYRPSFIGLGHELVHAWVEATGNPLVGETFQLKLAYEEYGASGITRKHGRPNANYKYNENTFRKECGCAAQRLEY
jgi:hypothetical protein